MNLSERIDTMAQWGQAISSLRAEQLDGLCTRAYHQNQWFTPENIKQSLSAITTKYLAKEKLDQWVSNYDLPATPSQHKVGLIMAGNIPLVGFHDLLCTYITGHKAIVKCSSKDEVLLPALLDLLRDISPEAADSIQIVDRMTGQDAVIATGGDTAAVHFEYYFKHYPNIIRKNRNSVAVLDGSESPDDIFALGHDIFDYFGLGCRSVSKLYIPRDYGLDQFFEGIYDHRDIIHHNKYKNNFDYNHAIYILTQEKFLTNDFLIVREDPSMASRIACLHIERYDDIEEVSKALKANAENLQCVSSRVPIEDIVHIPLGQSQQPGLSDYADHVDTLDFLIGLHTS